MAFPAFAVAVGWFGLVTEVAAQGSAAADRAALVAVYDATGGAAWGHTTNWNTNVPLRQWYGVQTDTRGRVVGLDLAENGLTGTIPAALGNLDRLQSLELGGNDLTGAIPASLGELSDLRSLSLWGNELAGTIPTALRNLDKLEFLNLSGNSLTDRVPIWMGELSNLWLLWLGGNELTGTIPTALHNLNKLQALNLGWNDLTGTIPTWLGEMSSLRSLWLGGNDLTGTLPTALRNLDSLESLDLGGNRLTGTIPAWLGEMSSLRSLGLWGNALTGTIPTALRNLESLEVLNLDRNDLAGTVPTWLGELPNVRRLWLSDNELTGTIPAALRNLDNLESLNLGGNDLIGAVPTWMGELSNLRWLSLSGNELTGTIPVALGRLQELETLAVSWNPLSGKLPQSLTQLPRIRWLDTRATAVCAPTNNHFLAWLARVETFRGETCNRAPTTVDAIPAQTLTAPESRGESVAGYFADPDDDELAFSAESSQAARVTAIVSGDTVWLSAKEAGEASVAVTACDPDRLCADQIMRVTVQPESTGSQGDREALEAFYDATGGDAWADNTNWKTAAPLESWYGVTVGSSGRITGLSLWENGLSGAIPTALQSLDQLDVLELGGNSLAGPIPGWLGSMSSLRTLSLWGNELAGPVPAELGNLRGLWRLNLCCNDLSGSIPAALRNLGDLKWLWLSWNNLTGPIPNWVVSLGNLRGLSLGGNGFSGPIPAGLGALSDLRWLALGPNALTPGPIPAELGDLVLLEELYLGAANLTGPVPPELANLTSLRVLSLSGNGLSGAIPDELGGLASLSDLYLSGNFGLSGSLPPEWALPDLERLDIALTQTCAPDSWQEQLETIEFDGSRCGTEDRMVDVAVVYTASAREAAGGTAAVEAGIDLMIAATNQAFQDSGVLSRVALVARSEVSYAETGESLVDILRFIEPADGHMDSVHEMRDLVGADLLHLIPAESDVGGRAQLYGPFGLSVWPGWAVPHEFGHNLGLLHDRYEQSKGRLRPHPAYGYVNRPGLQLRARKPTQWRTIMAYSDECNDRFTRCRRVPRYSSPRERYNGEPTGIPFDAEAKAAAWGVTGPADAASVIDVTGPAIAAWRERPVGADPPTAATASADGQRPRSPGRLQAVPPGQPEGLFFDPLFATQEPSAGAAVAPGVPQPSDSISLRRRLVSVDFGQLGETVAELTLNLFEDAIFTGLVERTAPTFSGGYVLSGRLAGVEYGTMTLVVNGGIVAGRVWTPEATYRISPADGAFHAIRQVDPAQLPPLGDPLPRPLPEGDRRDPPRRQ
ncbi:MAG: leucine-rich repeat domain-containing protein [Gemmatimonadetes bacterium]|nr:leucine-rich repeat domain-containing protein [Gemmatimonadota bacterium]